MRVSDRSRNRFHRMARFWPIDRAESGTLPALHVAGAMVFVYISPDRTELRVSVDLDTIHHTLLRPGPHGTVPLRITVGDETVYLV